MSALRTALDRARGFRARCRIPRGWLGEREPRNRLERRAAQRGRLGATTRGPHTGRVGAVGADATRRFCATVGGSGGLPPGSVHTCKHLNPPQKTCGNLFGERCQGRPAGRPVRPTVTRTVWAWRSAVAAELEREVSTLAPGRRALGLSHRARKLRRCGTVVSVRECAGCGEGRPGSGRYRWDAPGAGLEGQDVPALCEARSCWLCQRRRAAPLRRWLEGAVRSLPMPDERTRWTFVTISPQYAPDSEGEVSARGLRARLAQLQSAVRAVMKAGLEGGFIHAGFVAFELAGTGHVHAHALVASRYLDREWIDRVCSVVGERQVHVWLEAAEGETAREVAKYVTKLISPLDEAALAGLEPRELPDPRLAAAWEVATYGARLHERYGALRSVPYLESKEPPAPDDATTVCDSCGCVGSWRDALRPTRAWVRSCALRGVAALEGSLQVDRRALAVEARAGWSRPEWGRAGCAREHTKPSASRSAFAAKADLAHSQ